MSKASDRRARRAANADILAEIVGMDDAALKNLQHEIGREINLRSAAIATLRCRLDAVRRERERRATATTHGVHISDHAVIRFLERHKGIDVQAAREEIAQIALRSGRRGVRYDRAIDAETGLRFGFNGEKNIVTTVLTDRETVAMTTPHDDAP